MPPNGGNGDPTGNVAQWLQTGCPPSDPLGELATVGATTARLIRSASGHGCCSGCHYVNVIVATPCCPDGGKSCCSDAQNRNISAPPIKESYDPSLTAPTSGGTSGGPMNSTRPGTQNSTPQSRPIPISCQGNPQMTMAGPIPFIPPRDGIQGRYIGSADASMESSIRPGPPNSSSIPDPSSIQEYSTESSDWNTTSEESDQRNSSRGPSLGAADDSQAPVQPSGESNGEELAYPNSSRPGSASGSYSSPSRNSTGSYSQRPGSAAGSYSSPPGNSSESYPFPPVSSGSSSVPPGNSTGSPRTSTGSYSSPAPVDCSYASGGRSSGCPTCDGRSSGCPTCGGRSSSCPTCGGSSCSCGGGVLEDSRTYGSSECQTSNSTNASVGIQCEAPMASDVGHNIQGAHIQTHSFPNASMGPMDSTGIQYPNFPPPNGYYPPNNGSFNMGNGTYNVPPGNGTYNVPPGNGSFNAPPGNGSFNAPPGNGTFNAPPGNGTFNAGPTNQVCNLTPGSPQSPDDKKPRFLVTFSVRAPDGVQLPSNLTNPSGGSSCGYPSPPPPNSFGGCPFPNMSGSGYNPNATWGSQPQTFNASFNLVPRSPGSPGIPPANGPACPFNGSNMS